MATELRLKVAVCHFRRRYTGIREAAARGPRRAPAAAVRQSFPHDELNDVSPEITDVNEIEPGQLHVAGCIPVDVGSVNGPYDAVQPLHQPTSRLPALCLLVGVTRAAESLPPEAVDALLELLAEEPGPRRVSRLREARGGCRGRRP